MSNTDRLDKLIHTFTISMLAETVSMDSVSGRARVFLREYDLLPPDKRLPIPMRLLCPACHVLHIDEGDFAVEPHHTHACQSCGMVWRPAIAPTVGVQFLPGFKNA